MLQGVGKMFCGLDDLKISFFFLKKKLPWFSTHYIGDRL